jgi:hypothetical protein
VITVKLISLVFDGEVVGYRVQGVGKPFDLSLDVASELKLTPSNEKLTLQDYNGTLMTKKEFEETKPVEDISENSVVIAVLFSKKHNLTIKDILTGVDVAKKLAEVLDGGSDLTLQDLYDMSLKLNLIILAKKGKGIYELGLDLQQAAKAKDMVKLAEAVRGTLYDGKAEEAIPILRKGIANFIAILLDDTMTLSGRL